MVLPTTKRANSRTATSSVTSPMQPPSQSSVMKFKANGVFTLPLMKAAEPMSQRVVEAFEYGDHDENEPVNAPTRKFHVQKGHLAADHFYSLVQGSQPGGSHMGHIHRSATLLLFVAAAVEERFRLWPRRYDKSI
uniref:Uncharacterized protein n=1 Tax=Romanomermis culicivorax TaxID=13658 RepID=A0A915HJM7_ROMCU